MIKAIVKGVIDGMDVIVDVVVLVLRWPGRGKGTSITGDAVYYADEEE